jgi:hypothetical protein
MRGLAYWCMLIIPALRRQRQEDREFEANLYYSARLSPNHSAMGFRR